MSAAILGSLIIWLIVAIIVIAVVVYFVNWLYHRSCHQKDRNRNYFHQ